MTNQCSTLTQSFTLLQIQVPAGKDRLEYVNTLRGDPVEQAEEDMPLTPPADSDDEGSESMLDSKQLHASLTLEAPENAPLVVDWHRDAYPWVCVLMLSDVSLAIYLHNMYTQISRQLTRCSRSG